VAVRFDPRRLEHGGPINAVGFEDVLGDEVLRGGPEDPEVLPVGISDAGDVVDQGVEPDIGDKIFVEGQGNSPGEATLRAGDAEIFQGFPEERQGFVAVTLRSDEIRILFNVLDQPVLILAHPEEIVALLPVLRFALVIGTQAVHQLLFHVEAFAADAVESLVVAEVDVAGVIDLLEDHPYDPDMIFIGGADEVIVVDVQFRPEGPELGADAVGIGLGIDAGLLGGLGDLVAVFVRAGHEKGPVSGKLMITRQDIGEDCRIGMADVRRGIDIVNRGRDIIVLVHGILTSRGLNPVYKSATFTVRSSPFSMATVISPFRTLWRTTLARALSI